ncbi:alpha-L-fucosidase [Paenibacillus agaridevorans]|uniref:alpha-L-fucosidase n=1 Tax=Paenibacillus agaridevorans TaxID=171404 RepID=A0A2R5EUV7_9BACL|nr:alpha-L-fucosidase [Paenibacillus agaridevorans]GBG07573.1 alpha-L-fucosidase [Paenibacillus agaridevorans]
MTTELAKPTPAQLRWQDLELGLFCHFGINTFYDQEWGHGTEDPKRFHPTAFDATQWVKAAKDAGFRYLILTAKHHDGFCLWPTATTDHSVKASPWKDGRGDVVREVADACAEAGILFGIYLSPWDRHASCYPDKEAYDEFYCRQLTELLTGYGPLVEVWFDGAGSEGREYDWGRIMSLVTKHQPEAMVFNLGRPTIRWVGNEDGVAPYPCWNTAETAKVSMFTKDMLTWLPDTPGWVPAECDVPIRELHWFWHPDDEHSLKSLDRLIDIYYRSVGHGTNLLLNISPDDRGLLPDPDVKRLLELSGEMRRRFSNPIGETSGTGETVSLEWKQAETFDHVVIMEEIAEGERIREYTLEARVDGKWVRLATGSAIGHKKIDRVGPVHADGLRLRVMSSVGTPLIRRLGCYATGSGR